MTDFSCNSTYRLRYWNLFEVIFVASASNVATVLTVYGIETHYLHCHSSQHQVAIVPTVCGIETLRLSFSWFSSWVATVLTVYGIETLTLYVFYSTLQVVTVPIVYGIETLLTYHKYLWFVFCIAIAFTVYNFRVFLHFRTSKYLLFQRQG